ncbi:MAG: hypothetical protein R3A10_18535 [Caldilineaceae bacterium]
MKNSGLSCRDFLRNSAIATVMLTGLAACALAAAAVGWNRGREGGGETGGRRSAPGLRL